MCIWVYCHGKKKLLLFECLFSPLPGDVEGKFAFFEQFHGMLAEILFLMFWAVYTGQIADFSC